MFKSKTEKNGEKKLIKVQIFQKIKINSTHYYLIVLPNYIFKIETLGIFKLRPFFCIIYDHNIVICFPQHFKTTIFSPWLENS